MQLFRVTEAFVGWGLAEPGNLTIDRRDACEKRDACSLAALGRSISWIHPRHYGPFTASRRRIRRRSVDCLVALQINDDLSVRQAGAFVGQSDNRASPPPPR